MDHTDGDFGAGIRGADMIRVPTSDGDNPFLLLRIRKLRGLFGAGNPWDRQLPVTKLDSPLLNMLNVGWLAGVEPVSPENVAKAGLIPDGSYAAVNLYRNPNALPRFYLTPAVRRSPGERETFQMLADSRFQPSREAIVEGIPADRAGLATGPVVVNLYSANRISLTVEIPGPAFLVTSEAMYPGWEASVNGKPQPIRMTNGAFRGLELEAGKSEITMTYRPRFLAISAFISLAALLTAACLAVFGRRVQ